MIPVKGYQGRKVAVLGLGRSGLATARALIAGAVPTMPLADMFWGDRYGQVKDPFGHGWSIGAAIGKG